jgi:hypothetical protein
LLPALFYAVFGRAHINFVGDIIGNNKNNQNTSQTLE